METRIGISGWTYAPWRKIFYPPDLVHKRELEYASGQLNSIEINGSFYSLQRATSWQRWHDEVPHNFCFSVKGPRFVTHVRRLKNVDEPLANFYGSGVLQLRKKLGPFLWQLPPNFLFDSERLEAFFKILPRTVGDAAGLADKANRVEPSYPDGSLHNATKLRHCLEVRHHSFENPEFIDLLRAYDVALVFADTAGKWPYMEDLTSDFVYVRLHGEREIYASGYGKESLKFWAKRVAAWRGGGEPPAPLSMSFTPPTSRKRDIFVYFDNDNKVRAPIDAMALTRLVL